MHVSEKHRSLAKAHTEQTASNHGHGRDGIDIAHFVHGGKCARSLVSELVQQLRKHCSRGMTGAHICHIVFHMPIHADISA